MSTLYTVKKIGGMWRVIMAESEKIQFSSASRKNCLDWMADNVKQ